MDLTILSEIRDAKKELATDVMWVRDDLREMLLAQANEMKRLQAVVWVLTQLTAEKLGVSSEDLSSRVAKAMTEVGGPSR